MAVVLGRKTVLEHLRQVLFAEFLRVDLGEDRSGPATRLLSSDDFGHVIQQPLQPRDALGLLLLFAVELLAQRGEQLWNLAAALFGGEERGEIVLVFVEEADDALEGARLRLCA